MAIIHISDSRIFSSVEAMEAYNRKYKHQVAKEWSDNQYSLSYKDILAMVPNVWDHVDIRFHRSCNHTLVEVSEKDCLVGFPAHYSRFYCESTLEAIRMAWKFALLAEELGIPLDTGDRGQVDALIAAYEQAELAAI
jgi:hypothetical protein